MFIVLDVQKDSAETIRTYVRGNKSAALNLYHKLLAVAATSSFLEHTIILIGNNGGYVQHETYYHDGNGNIIRPVLDEGGQE